MRCPKCRSTAVEEGPERTAQCYRRCLDCTKQFNERSGGLLNRMQYPSDVIALVVLWRLRYKLSLRDLAEMFLSRGLVFTYEAVRDWAVKLVRTALALASSLAGEAVAALDPVARDALGARLRTEVGNPMAVLTRVVLLCYCRDDRVLMSLGLEPRPPFPKGYELEQGEWSLLDPVKARKPFWRQT
jgi:hypothetical protein